MTLTATADANARTQVHAAPVRTHVSPAKLAREQLAANPDLSENPFGELVSKFAAEQQESNRGHARLPSSE